MPPPLSQCGQGIKGITMRNSIGAFGHWSAWAVAGAVVVVAVRAMAAPAGEATASFATYDYSEMDEGHQKSVRLAIPTGLLSVRGLLVNTNAAGGDTRTRYTLPYLKAFATLHSLAFRGRAGV